MAYSQDYRPMILDKLNSGYKLPLTGSGIWHKPQYHSIMKKVLNANPTKKTNKINDKLLRKDVEQFLDDFQRERAVQFKCSQRAIGVALKRLKITQKKMLKHPKAQYETIEQ